LSWTQLGPSVAGGVAPPSLGPGLTAVGVAAGAGVLGVAGGAAGAGSDGVDSLPPDPGGLCPVIAWSEGQLP
jgi:hypothetical protein